MSAEILKGGAEGSDRAAILTKAREVAAVYFGTKCVDVRLPRELRRAGGSRARNADIRISEVPRVREDHLALVLAARGVAGRAGRAMSEYTPTTKDVREVWIYAQDITHDEGEDFHGAEFDRWLATHDAEVRAEVESDPAKDDRLVRYMAMVTPLGYQSALSVVQQMTLMIQAETEARRAGVVAEEPEWGIANAKTPDRVWPLSEEGARETAAAEPGQWIIYSRPKTVVHEWVPVKQENDND